MQAELLVFFSTLAAMVLLCVFKDVRQFWASVLERKISSVLIILAFISVFSVSNTVGSSNSISLDSARVIRLVALCSLLLLSTFSLLRIGGAFGSSGASAKWMLAYALLAIFSAVYSDDYLLTLWKGFEVLVIVFGCIATAQFIRQESDIHRLVNVLNFVLLFLCVSVVIGWILFPSLAYAHLYSTGEMAFMIQGVLPPINPNSVSQIGAFLFCLTLARILGGNEIRITLGAGVILLLAVTVLLLGHGRTSLFACMFATSGLLLLTRKIKLALLFVLLLLVLLLLPSVFEFVESYIYRGQTVENFESLSGRLVFWAKLRDAILDSPIAGHGFYSAQRTLFGTATVDNTYLEVLLGLGMMGLIALVGAEVALALDFLRTFPNKVNGEVRRIVWLQLLMLFLIILIRSLSGPSIQVLHHNLVHFVLVGVCLAGLKRVRASNSSGR